MLASASSLFRSRSEEHTSELQSRQYLHSFPTRRSSDLPAGAAAEDFEILRRQPAEDRARARDRARAQGAARGPADPRRRYRRHRIHPPPSHCAARCWRRHPPCFGRDRKSTRLNSSHANIYTLSLHDALPICPRAPRLKTSKFSGGNQQKIVLAREIEREPKVLLVGQPTRGVDIGAIEFIHRRLIALRDAGVGILLVSVELDEIMNLSDRILTMCGGKFTGERRASETNEQDLGLLMAGVTDEAA